MSNVIFLVGLSGSGKSTLTRKLCDDFWAYELNRDNIRFSEIDPGGNWGTYNFTPENESKVTGIWLSRARELLKKSGIIIVSDTNVDLKSLKKNLQFFRKHGRGSSFIIMDVPWAECLKRDRLREEFSVGYEVIEKQYAKYVKTVEWIKENHAENWINYSQFSFAYSMLGGDGY